MARKPQGIIDDIIKLGAKGTKTAINTTIANKRYVKKIQKSPISVNKTKEGYKNQGALSYKKNIQRAANEQGIKIPKPKKVSTKAKAVEITAAKKRNDLAYILNNPSNTKSPNEVAKILANARGYKSRPVKQKSRAVKRKSAIEGK